MAVTVTAVPFSQWSNPTPAPSYSAPSVVSTPSVVSSPSYNMGTVNLNSGASSSPATNNVQQPTNNIQQTAANAYATGGIKGFNQAMVNANSNTPNYDLNFGNSGSITQQQYQDTIDYYNKKFDPFYNQETTYDKNLYSQNQLGLNEDFEALNKSYRQNLEADIYDLNDQEGKSGTYASTGRKMRAGRLQDKYNNLFDNNARLTARSLLSNKLKQAYQYGDVNVADANNGVTSLNANLSDYTARINPFETKGQYNPFGFTGRKIEERKNAGRYAANDYWNNILNTPGNQLLNI